MSYIPKYIIKRMFPKKKCLKVVKKDGKRWIAVQMVNVMSPISVPDGPIDLGGFNPEDIGNYLEIKVNGKDIGVSYESIKNHVELWTQGTGYTLDDILVNNKAAGVTIPVGGKLTLLISEDYSDEAKELAAQGPGDYEVVVNVKEDNPMSLTVKAELVDYDVDFDPADT